MKRTLLALAVSILLPSVAQAELLSLTIHARERFAKGKEFGAAGAYEKIAGVAKFAVDPKNSHNQKIVDLDLAPRNAKGLVEFQTDVVILAPENVALGNGAIFYDVNNRGNKLALRFFNFGPGGNDLDKPGSEGDGFLMRRGYTVVWCGWIGEVLAGDGRLRLAPPVAHKDGKPIRGMVRFELIADSKSKSLPLSRREGHVTFSPTLAGLTYGTLTVRALERDERKNVPREKWNLVKAPPPKLQDTDLPPALDQWRVEMERGFEPGMLYELICECEGSLVQGTGFAAVRDLISFLRHDESKSNPLRKADGKPGCTRAYAFGVSQSGRFLRHLLWEGFNLDEQGRIVFEGLIPHVAGGGLGFFNHRFAQPTRHNGQHEDHLYPADVFPFTYGPSVNPFTQKRDGILEIYDKKQQPKVMHTQSAAEYWHRAGSLVHTDPLGKADADIPDNVRIYAFGGTQHGPAADPPSRGVADNLANPGDYRPFLRALLDALDAWVRLGKSPPPSVYPRIVDKTLVDWSQAGTGFPNLPGVRYPQVIQQPVFADWGPEFLTKGIIGKEPPIVKGDYKVLVAKSDADGNDLGCLLVPEVAVPLATYTGWNLRREDVGADGQLASLMGSYIPFAKSKAEREKAGDARLSLEERYGGFDKYQNAFSAACEKLATERYFIAEDVARAVKGLEKMRATFPAVK
ncbi:MAG: hypothetical protein L0215_05555 [Gemmataceae bacterium]|nr:hypothetical protein [Gemmataceae bacterium]